MRTRVALLSLLIGLSALPASAQVAGGGEAARAMATCGGNLAQLNQLTGWQVRWPQELAAIATLPPAERDAALARWHAAPAALRADVTILRQGLKTGQAAPAGVARRVLAQADALLAEPLAPGLTDPAWRRFLDGELSGEIAAYAVFLRDAYIPMAPAGSPLATSPAGRACFDAAVQQWSSRSISAQDLEAMGRRYLADYRAELTRLAGRPLETAPQILAQLREQSRTGAASRDDILNLSRAAIARADTAAPRAFDVAKVAPLEVRPVPSGLESSLPAGLYERATASQPAAYAINLSRPAERRLMVEAIAFHEGVPGHHLAFSTAATPGAFNSGFVEGWAIYAEHLADELGLYSGSEDRVGAAAKHLWASARLIVEPSLHVHGWTRGRAIAFMRENTPLSDEEIAVEVDRYLALPGQSVAYMVGYDAIRRARDRTRQREGTAFDLKAFHRRLLAPGSQSLDTIEAAFP